MDIAYRFFDLRPPFVKTKHEISNERRVRDTQYTDDVRTTSWTPADLEKNTKPREHNHLLAAEWMLILSGHKSPLLRNFLEALKESISAGQIRNVNIQICGECVRHDCQKHFIVLVYFYLSFRVLFILLFIFVVFEE